MHERGKQMKLAESIFKMIYEMGRSRKDMRKLIFYLSPTIEEHLWKIWAYHNDRPQDVRGWIVSLNKHLDRLRKYNVPEKGNRPNLTKKEMYLNLAIRPFQRDRDIEIITLQWKGEGYPEKDVPAERIKDLQDFAKKYVDLIFEKSGKFEIGNSKLL